MPAVNGDSNEEELQAPLLLKYFLPIHAFKHFQNNIKTSKSDRLFFLSFYKIWLRELMLCSHQTSETLFFKKTVVAEEV